MNILFEFDPQKSASNKSKHGINFVEAQALWKENKAEYQLGTSDEVRYAVIGRIRKKYWTAIITYRGPKLRIISVRSSSPSEIQYHERKFGSQ